jgi:transcriptional regulator with XRE-family HTH domain
VQAELSVFNGLGPALRFLREKVARLTQVEVERRSGIAQSRLSRYENGKLLDLTTLDRLLSCYGVDAEALGRALREAQGILPAPPADPELTARVREALVQLGYSKPFPTPKS